MAKRDFYANRKVILGEAKKDGEDEGKRTEIEAGATAPLEADDPEVKRLVERGALTPAPAKGEAPAAPKGAGTK